MTPKPRKRMVRRRQSSGLSLVEVVVGLTVTAIVYAGVANCTTFLARSADIQQTQMPGISSGRAALDEALSQLRSGGTVLSSPQTVNGVTCKTDSQNIVFSAPAYNPTQSGLVLRDSGGNAKTDIIALQYDAQSQKLTEYVQPSTGSYRPARTGFVLAKNVSSAAYTYHVRHVQEQFTQTLTSAGPKTLNLNAMENIVGNVKATLSVAGAPAVSVPVIYDPTLHAAIVANLPIGNIVITIDYDVSAKTISSTDTAELPYVSQVDMQLQMTGSDSRSVAHTVNVAGSAFLRNNQRPQN